ncbi:MAG: rhomboid family intramembrane serine protease [Planctomycetes bacterium]|nr:rhomboid family intramembrane serine protease [Planctomycetota bacterium]
MIPLTVDVPMKRLPWANWALILATVVISLAVPYGTEEVSVRSFEGRIQVRTRHDYSPLVLQREGFATYQLVTALFQHADLIHLFGNMLFLFVFGNAINAKLGHSGFLASYLGIGVLVHLVWLAVGGGEAYLGASGAIMGVCGMFLVLYPRNGVRVFWGEGSLALLARSWTGEIPGWAIVLLYLAFDVWGAIFDRKTNIAYVSHIVGGLLGIALAIVLVKGGWLTPDRGEQTLLQWLSGQGPVEEDVPARPRRRKKRLPS